MKLTNLKSFKSYRRQADAFSSTGNPVSGTYYPVLNDTGVRIVSIFSNVTWAVTQPNPINIRVIIDGITIVHVVANPVTATNYGAVVSGDQVETAQGSEAAAAASSEKHRTFLYEGQTISVAVAVVWAVTQPTPLNCRVKWEKLY